MSHARTPDQPSRRSSDLSALPSPHGSVAAFSGEQHGVLAGTRPKAPPAPAAPAGAPTTTGTVPSSTKARPQTSGHASGVGPAYGYLGLVVLATAALIMAPLLVPDSDLVGSVLYNAVLLSLVPALVIGIRRNKPASAAPWNWFVVGAVLFLVAELGRLLLVADSTSVATAAIVEGVAALGYVAQILGLMGLLRRRRGRDVAGASLDALVVGLAGWILVWTWLIRPTFEFAAGFEVLVVVQGLYQPLGVVIVYLVLRLVFTSAFRQASYWLLSIGLVTTLTGDLVYALVASGHLSIDPDVFAPLYMLAVGFIGASALHPSMRSLTERHAVSNKVSTPTRSTLVAASISVPVLVLGFIDQPPDGRFVVALSSVLLMAIVTVSVMRAVVLNGRAQAKLLVAAHRDALTGLPNRFRLVDLITEALHVSWSNQTSTALLFIDLDRFKNINDSLGHEAGDQLLRTVAGRFVSALPDDCRVARMSGDEFVVLLPAVGSEAKALDLAERLLTCLREPIALPQGDMFVTASVGVALVESRDESSAEELLRNADTAMYRAKDAGRNCVALFDPSMHERIASRLDTETALRRALEREELRLHHQPIVDLPDGRLSGFEALVRWQRPDVGLVSPAEFIPIAEDTGLIVPIGSWVMLEALNQLAEWTATGVCSPEATMSINVSPRQLYDDHLVTVLDEALRRTKVDPSRVWLEVTESIMITDPVRALEVLERLHDLGVKISVDDFGTGYASLSVLKRYPVDRIKIDRSFVSDLDGDQGDRNLVRLIIDMAHGLGHDVVAEGIETRPQLAILQALGCDRGQGYLFSAPVAAENMVARLDSYRSDRAA